MPVPSVVTRTRPSTALGHAVPRLGQPRGVGVVEHPHLAAEPLAEQVVGVGADPALVDVGRRGDHAALADHPGHGDADGRGRSRRSARAARPSPPPRPRGWTSRGSRCARARPRTHRSGRSTGAALMPLPAEVDADRVCHAPNVAGCRRKVAQIVNRAGAPRRPRIRDRKAVGFVSSVRFLEGAPMSVRPALPARVRSSACDRSPVAAGLSAARGGRPARRPTRRVVISEVYGGERQRQRRRYARDFVELYNPTSAAGRPRRHVGAVPLRAPAPRTRPACTELTGTHPGQGALPGR